MGKIKNLLSKIKINKYAYLILAILATLFIVLYLRGCSNVRLSKKTNFLIGRETTLQVELLGRERNLIAFTNDLLAQIGAENKLSFQWVDTNPRYLMEGLDNGSYDFILTSLRPNVVNQENYDFSEPIFNLGPVLIVRQESQVTSLKEIQSKPIGIAYGFATNFNSVRSPGMNIYDLALVYYNNMNRALDDLKNDHIDGVIMKAMPAYAITKGLHAGRLKVVTPPFNDEGMRIVSLKSTLNDEVINIINESINKMRQNGAYNAFIVKWGLINPQSQYWQPARAQENIQGQ